MENERLRAALTLLDVDALGQTCPTRKIVEQVTSRWGTLVLAVLATGPHRFAAVRDRIGGISEKMLAQTLKQLVRAGLVDRAVDASVPPQVTYSLTELGAGLATPLCELIQWLGEHTPEIVRAQQTYDGLTER